MAQGQGEPRLKVFLSYARVDLAAAERVRNHLMSDCFEAHLDTHDILPGEAWQERLGHLIAGAHGVVFLISPDSVKSQICDWEVNEAERLSKRILPVVVRDTPATEVPGRLKRLNYIFMREVREEEQGLTRLTAALLTDIDWSREHTRLGELAADWQARGAPRDLLLRGAPLAAAELWLSQPAAERQPPSEIHRHYITSSRRGEQVEAEAERQRLARMRRYQRRAGWALTAVGITLALGGVAVVWQDIETSKREQTVFLNPVDRAIADGHHDRAIRYGLAALPSTGRWPWSPVSESLLSRLRGAALMTPARALLQGHTGQLTWAEFNPDATRVVTASKDGTARVWDTFSGRQLTVLAGHSGAALKASFSSDGARIVTAGDDATVRIWETTSGRPLAVLEIGDSFGEFAEFKISPDGKQLVTSTSRSNGTAARVWDMARGNAVVDLTGHKAQIHSLDYSPDGRRIVAGSEDATARVWDAESGQVIVVLEGHESRLHSVRFSPDGSRIVTSADDGTVRLWDAATGKQLLVRDVSDHRVLMAAFNPSGNSIVSGDARMTVLQWDAATGKAIGEQIGSPGPPARSPAYSPDGSMIATINVAANSVDLWNSTNSVEIGVLAGHTDTITSLSYSRDGKYILTSSGDHTARIWQARAPSQLLELKGQSTEVSSAAFDGEGLRVVTASKSDGKIQVWDARSARIIRTISSAYVKSAEFSPSGSHILTSSDNAARLWDAKSGSLLTEFMGHSDPLSSVRFNYDGTRVVTAAEDQSVKIWNVATGTVETNLEIFARVAVFDRTGTRVATGSGDGSIVVWDATTARPISQIAAPNRIQQLVFSRDGSRIFAAWNRSVGIWQVANASQVAIYDTGGHDVFDFDLSPDEAWLVTAGSSLQVWDVAAARRVALLIGHSQPLRSVRFSADGLRLVTASGDATSRLWDASWLKTEPHRVFGAICSNQAWLGSQSFTDAELRDPILERMSSHDPSSRNPCLRRGPLSLDFWTRLPGRLYLK